MGAYLMIRFSNENDLIDAHVGWSTNGRTFADERATAFAILPGNADGLVDMTLRQLVTSLLETLPRQAADADPFIGEMARKALAYFTDAVAAGNTIIYTLDADGESFPEPHFAR